MFLKFITTLCIFIFSGLGVFGASGDTVETPKTKAKTVQKIEDIKTPQSQSKEILPDTQLPPDSLKNKENQEEKPKKVEEIQSDIKLLEKEKQRLEFKWNTFRIGNENLGDLIRKDLTDIERNKLELLVTNYTSLKNKGDSDISIAIENGKNVDKLRSDVLQLKQKLYTALIPYIQINKIASFKTYIQSDITYNEKSKNVAIKIEKKQETQNTRVEQIQEKIEQNSEVLRKQIEAKITESFQTKLDAFISQEAFESLKDESKVILFERLSEKVSFKKSTLESIVDPTSVIQERIFLYQIVEEILNTYIQDWK